MQHSEKAHFSSVSPAFVEEYLARCLERQFRRGLGSEREKTDPPVRELDYTSSASSEGEADFTPMGRPCKQHHLGEVLPTDNPTNGIMSCLLGKLHLHSDLEKEEMQTYHHR